MNPGLSGDVADQATGTSAGEQPAGPAQFGRPARSLGGLIGSLPTGASPREQPPRGAFLIREQHVADPGHERPGGGQGLAAGGLQGAGQEGFHLGGGGDVPLE
jgi:hypothetical protein